MRLLGSVLNNSSIVEKLLVTIPEKFEATITTLENTEDLSKISLTELLNALQAQEQRRSMRQEGVIEDALLSIKTTTGIKTRKLPNTHRRMEIYLPIIKRQKEEVPKNPIHLAAIVRRKVIHHTSVGEDLTPSAPNAINMDMKL